MEDLTRRQKLLRARRDLGGGDGWDAWDPQKSKREETDEALSDWKREEEEDAEEAYEATWEHDHDLDHVKKWAYLKDKRKRVEVIAGATYNDGKGMRDERKRLRDVKLGEALKAEAKHWEKTLVMRDLDDPDRAPGKELTERSRENFETHIALCMPKVQAPGNPRLARCEDCIEDAKEGIFKK
ncbi:hypothetical protein EAF04_010388 [Stromatinia cepivora]|nr:hypothetical protein EAF04_010388 [Stromatinia cepivora]